MIPVTLEINAVAYEEKGVWIAHCLEYSFVSCAETLEALPNELLDQILDQIEADLGAGNTPFFGFKPAPQKYWEMWEAAKAASPKPIKPHKSLSYRCREWFERPKINARLFPVAAYA